MIISLFFDKFLKACFSSLVKLEGTFFDEFRTLTILERKPRSIKELKNAITTDISTINSNIRQTVYRSVTDRLRRCLAVGGQQFERLS